MTRSRLAAGLFLVAIAAGCSSGTETASSTRSTIATSPASVAADGAATAAITVTAEDSSGQPIAALAVALAVSGGSANVLTPASGMTSSTGVFTATIASTTAGMKTVSATLGSGATAVTISTTVSFTATAPSAMDSTFTASPSSVTADGTTTKLTVTVADAEKNPVGGQSVSLTSTGSGNTFTPASGMTDATGVFTATLASTAAETKTITATVGSLSLTTMVTFTAGAPAAANTTIAAASPTLTADGTSTDAITVSVKDANGNPVVGASVTLSGSGAGDKLTPASGMTAADGTFAAAFSTTTAGTPTITATIATGTPVTASTTVTANPGAFSATTSSIQASPGMVVADGMAQVMLTVTGKDANGNALVGASVSLSASGMSNMFSGTAGTLDLNGQFTATLSSMVVQTEAITAAIGGSDSTVSTMVTFVPGAPANAVFTTQPSSTTAGAALSPAVGVALQDQFGNVITTDSTTTVSLTLNSANGAALGGTTSVTASAGVAQFPGVSIAKAGTGYTLVITATGYRGQTSMPFTITAGGMANAAFTVQPSMAAAGATITPAVVVALQDMFGNTILTDSTTQVTLAFGANPSMTTLLGTTTATAVAGIATFSTLSIQHAGTGYTLTATATGYQSATSSAFDITAGAMANAVFTAQPTNAAAGVALSPAVVVTLQDMFGNTLLTDSTQVTVSIGTNAGGATLSGTLTQTPVNGVATFPDLSLNKAGTGYTLTAAATGYTSATSTQFNIAPAGPATAVFATQPGNAVAGAGIPATVTLQDAFGNTITSDSSTVVTLAIGTNPGGGTLSGSVSATASGGVATFTTDAINKAGSGYTLTASASGYATGTSAAFNVVAGAMANAVFTGQPTNTVSTASISPAVVVTLEDGFGNTLLTDSTTAVTIALGTNASGGTLSGMASVTASSGVATFSTLSIDKAGTGYTLMAAAPGYTGSPSSPFNITVGAPSSSTSSVAASPASVPADGSTQITLTATVQDAGGNPITGQTVTFSADGSNNTFSVTSCTTMAGTCSVQLSSTSIQMETVTATIGSVQKTAMVTFNNCLHGSQVFQSAGGATFTAPACFTSVTVKAWGGGGGGGGLLGGGGSGGGGAYATSTIAVTPGEMLNVIVGGGGGYANSNCVANMGGGLGGVGAMGIGAGGPGGNAGPSGCDGAGGGGGGGSFVLRGSTPLIVAGGGGGGGGLESNSGGFIDNGGGGGVSAPTATFFNCGAAMPGGQAGASATTNGVQGHQDANDGPGSGGGGGGLRGGGAGGVDQDVGTDCDNYPAGGGGGGTSLGDTVMNGSYQTPGNANDPDIGGAGRGALSATPGNAGLVKISW